MSLDLILFLVLALVAVATALGMLLSQNAVYSALFLVLNFTTVAIFYLLLGAPFIAMSQIPVYAGAIMVLFLFVIMLLNLNKATEQMKSMGMRIAAVTGGGLLFITLAAAIRHGVNITATNAFDPGVGLVRTVGHVLFTEFLLPFEVSSVLFLSAIVGVVMLARKDKHLPNALVEPLTEAERTRRTA